MIRSRRVAITLGLALASLLTTLPARAATMTFDSLTCQSSIGTLDGFTFSANWVTECDDDYASTWGNTSGAPSPGAAAGNTYADPTAWVTISRALPFNLLGGQASSFLVNDDFDFMTPLSSASLLIEGYLGGVFVDSLSINFDPGSGGTGAGYTSFGALLGVDELRFFSSFDQLLTGGPDYWLVDDLELTDVTPTAPVPVPEPASLLLLGSGLAVVARHRRRLTRSAR